MATLSIVDASGAFAALGVYANGFSTLRFEINDYDTRCDGFYFYLDGVEYKTYYGGLVNKTRPWVTEPYHDFGLCNLSVGQHTLRVHAFDGDILNPTVTYHDITITFRVANYNAPAISLFSAKRCTSGGVDADDGTYVKYSLVASVNPANDGLVNKNSPLFRVRYKVSGTTTWSYTTIESVVFVIAHTNVVLNLGLSAGQTFDFEAYVTDKWKSATAATLLPKDNVPFSWADGRFAIGKVTTQDGFDCDYASRFRKAVTFDLPVGVRASLKVPTVCSGTIASVSLAADAVTTVDVSFPAGLFSTAPDVVATVKYAMGYSSTNLVLVAVDPTETTASKARFRIMRRGAAITVALCWTASEMY